MPGWGVHRVGFRRGWLTPIWPPLVFSDFPVEGTGGLAVVKLTVDSGRRPPEGGDVQSFWDGEQDWLLGAPELWPREDRLGLRYVSPEARRRSRRSLRTSGQSEEMRHSKARCT